MTLRHRTMKLGQHLDEKARERAWFEPPSTAERRQIELSSAECERAALLAIEARYLSGFKHKTDASRRSRRRPIGTVLLADLQGDKAD